jgi:hypothetical protein
MVSMGSGTTINRREDRTQAAGLISNSSVALHCLVRRLGTLVESNRIYTRRIIMKLALTEGNASLAAWEEYRLAFRHFARSVQNVQRVMERPNPDYGAVGQAILESERARAIYARYRNALARQLLRTANHDAVANALYESPKDMTARVHEIAELLWKAAGKPDGTAEKDWYRAEEIVRCAAMARHPAEFGRTLPEEVTWRCPTPS